MMQEEKRTNIKKLLFSFRVFLIEEIMLDKRLFNVFLVSHLPKNLTYRADVLCITFCGFAFGRAF
jgi:hypothetical protein